MNRGPAISATVIAVALVNIGIAAIVATSIGRASFGASWIGELILVLGIAATVAAVVLWRGYLAEVRAR